jgi:hypothetical protein
MASSPSVSSLKDLSRRSSLARGAILTTGALAAPIGSALGEQPSHPRLDVDRRTVALESAIPEFSSRIPR